MKTIAKNKEEASPEKIFIGTGGTNPGIDMLDIETGMPERVLSLPSGNSAYAIGVSSDGNILAVGTKGSYFHWLTKKDPSDTNCNFQDDKFIQGSAILSVCLLDNFRAAATDVSGRCLIWQPDSPKKVEKLSTEGNVICSLFKPIHDHLAGICTDGKLLLWDINSLEIIDILQVPKPPSLAALVKPIWWGKVGYWTWPGCNGTMVLFDYEGGKINTLAGHQTDAYGICICGDKLLTAGHKDSLLKIWESGSDKPAEILNIPQGVISAVSWPKGDLWKILFSMETGQSEVFTYKEGCIEFSHAVAVRNSRVLVGPDIEKCKARQQQKITAEAEGIYLQIQQNISEQKYDQLPELHQKLENLGFEDASLLLKARAAQTRGDLLSELKAYCKLDRFLNSSLEQMPNNFERYAQLLREFWLIKQTIPLYTRLNNTAAYSTKYDQDIRQLTDYLTVIEKGQLVIESGIELSLLLQAGSLMNNPVDGRFVVKHIDSFHVETIISSTDFIKCCESLKQKTQLLPPFEVAEQANWLSKSDNLVGDIIIFKNNNSGLEICVRFIGNGFDTFAKTAVLFNAGKPCSDSPIAQHNKQVSEKLELIQKSSHAAGFIRTVNYGIKHVIRQLTTKGLADKMPLVRSY